MILHKTDGETICLVIYKHKHGEDYAACRTEAAAWRVAASWAYEAVVVEKRHEDDHPQLTEMATTQPEDATDEECMKADIEFVEAYNEVEQDISYGEFIGVQELSLIS